MVRPTPVSALTQSRYYSAAFNAAIFDGPVRIYFAQYQEALALKVYFRIQDRLQGLEEETSRGRRTAPNVFVMLYPTEEIFSNSFSPEQAKTKIVHERLADDFVVGVCGPLKEDENDVLFTQIETLLFAKTDATVAPALMTAEA